MLRPSEVTKPPPPQPTCPREHGGPGTGWSSHPQILLLCPQNGCCQCWSARHWADWSYWGGQRGAGGTYCPVPGRWQRGRAAAAAPGAAGTSASRGGGGARSCSARGTAPCTRGQGAAFIGLRRTSATECHGNAVPLPPGWRHLRPTVPPAPAGTPGRSARGIAPPALGRLGGLGAAGEVPPGSVGAAQFWVEKRQIWGLSVLFGKSGFTQQGQDLPSGCRRTDGQRDGRVGGWTDGQMDGAHLSPLPPTCPGSAGCHNRVNINALIAQTLATATGGSALPRSVLGEKTKGGSTHGWAPSEPPPTATPRGGEESLGAWGWGPQRRALL